MIATSEDESRPFVNLSRRLLLNGFVRKEIAEEDDENWPLFSIMSLGDCRFNGQDSHAC